MNRGSPGVPAAAFWIDNRRRGAKSLIWGGPRRVRGATGFLGAREHVFLESRSWSAWEGFSAAIRRMHAHMYGYATHTRRLGNSNSGLRRQKPVWSWSRPRHHPTTARPTRPSSSGSRRTGGPGTATRGRMGSGARRSNPVRTDNNQWPQGFALGPLCMSYFQRVGPLSAPPPRHLPLA